MNLKSQLPPGTLLLVYWMPWTGDPKRVSRVQYDQTSPAVVNSQLDAMQASGIDGVIAVWQGPTRNLYTHGAWLTMFLACLKRGVPFLTMLDQWVAKGLPDPTQATIDALKHPDFQGALPFFTEKCVLEFDLANAAKVDLAKVRVALPDLPIWSWHVDYSWPQVDDTSPVANWTTLKRDNALPTVKVPCIFAGFDDGGYPLPDGVGKPSTFNGKRDWNKSVWDATKPKRMIEQDGGRTFRKSVELVPVNAKYVGLVTWNDYDEGTAVESWCMAFAEKGTR